MIGASVPELYHAGIRLHYIPKARFDFNFGSDFNKDDNGRLYALTINHAYYFKKNNWRFNKALWSINSGISFLVEKGVHEKSTASYLNLYFAREIPIAKKIFIQPELGASYFLFEQIAFDDYTVKSLSRTRIVPKFGIILIMKIWKTLKLND